MENIERPRPLEKQVGEAAKLGGLLVGLVGLIKRSEYILAIGIMTYIGGAFTTGHAQKARS